MDGIRHICIINIINIINIHTYFEREDSIELVLRRESV